ncbi:MAG: FecR family protein [Bacteroidales bacterium]|nr:FecR family protein [Bacteroidales bacterium]
MNDKNLTYWEKITRYFSGDTDKEEIRSIENWAHKSDKKVLLNKMKKDIKRVDSTKNMYSEKTDKAWLNVFSKINEEEQTQEFSVNRKFNFNFAFKIAAGIIILLGFVWGITQFVNPAEQITQTEFNQTKVILADGSIVYLNANSKLKYTKSFNKKIRKVKLIGEAFFEIAKNPDKAFIIETGNAEIKVMGTSFNVLAPENNEFVEVLVETGKVSLASRQNENTVVLKKGDYARLKDNNIQKLTLSDDNYLSWKTKRLDFRNTKLKDVIFVLNRTYMINIIIDSDSIKDLQLTSKFDNIKLETIIESICLTFDLKSENINNGIVLSSKN